MPETRQNKKIENVKVEGENDVTKLQCEILKQWVCLAPGCILTTINSESLVFTLPHSKSDRSTQFIFHNDVIYEMVKFKQRYQSWFISDVIQKDGSLYILTKIDPLFLFLNILECKSVKDKFVPLSQILVDERFHDLPNLEHCVSDKQLNNICETRNVDGESYYKVDRSKVIEWLKKKIHRLASHLIVKGFNLADGCHSASFKRNSIASSANKDDALRYAFGMVTDYVTDEITKELQLSLGIEEKKRASSTIAEPPQKKQKMTQEDLPCLEDYRESSKTVKTKKEVKLTSTQKSLAKEGKRGMKTMNSFFTKKSTK